jgi:archaellum biogenesis protein FlaJ (TadC family)
MGSSRAAQEVREKAEALTQRQENERKKRDLQNRLRLLGAQMAVLHSESELEKQELARMIEEEELKHEAMDKSRKEITRLRDGGGSH